MKRHYVCEECKRIFPEDAKGLCSIEGSAKTVYLCAKCYKRLRKESKESGGALFAD